MAAPRNDLNFPNRIPDDIKFVGEPQLIVIVGHAGTAKPWWITAGRIIVEANFAFDATTFFGDKLVIHQQQLLLNRSNLIWLPEYIFPYEVFESRFRLKFHWNKWLRGVTTEVFEYDP